jgi:AcrR family transcriptional regulator
VAPCTTTTSEHDLTTRSGRPRDAEASPALLAAARRLVTEQGYAATSISDIAAAAGTGRQTLYRRWPGKAQLILDAFTEHASDQVDDPHAAAPGPDPVREFLRRTFRALDETGPALRSLMAQAQFDPAFCELFRQRFIVPRRAALHAVLAQVQDSGSLPAGLDLDAAVAALFGALWYRLLLGEPLDDAYAAALADLIRARA